MDNNFECKICYKIFKYKYLLIRHNNNKILCNSKQSKIIKNIEAKIIRLDKLSLDSIDKCFYCDTNFKRKDSLKRHMEIYCNKRKMLFDNKNKIIIDNINTVNTINNDNKNNNEDDDNNIFDIKKELGELKKCIKDISKTNITNIQNTDNSKNINIVVNIGDINTYGKEDLSHITDKDYKYYLSKFLPGLIKYIEDVHFSDKMPSNHNLCISKLDSKYISIYERNNWNARDKDEILKKIITKKMSILDKKCEELNKNGIIEEQIVEKYNELFNTYYDGPEHTKQKFKDELEIMLFNNRKKINDYKNLLK
jgi:hypothetical protein